MAARGQRVLERTYDVMLSIVANTQANDFAETVDLIADQCVRAVGHLDQIAFDLQDFTVHKGEYHAAGDGAAEWLDAGSEVNPYAQSWPDRA